MNIPTIDHDQYDELLKETGEYGALVVEPFMLFAVEGTPEEIAAETAPSKGLRVMYLNVAQPSMYTDRQGKVIVVIPIGATYDDIDSFFPNDHKPWLYIITPYADSELDQRIYYWRDGRDEGDGNYALPKFDIADEWTH